MQRWVEEISRSGARTFPSNTRCGSAAGAILEVGRRPRRWLPLAMISFWNLEAISFWKMEAS